MHLFAHTKHSQKAGLFSVARLKMDLPFQNRLAYNRVHRRSASPLGPVSRRRGRERESGKGHTDRAGVHLLLCPHLAPRELRKRHSSDHADLFILTFACVSLMCLVSFGRHEIDRGAAIRKPADVALDDSAEGGEPWCAAWT